MVHHLANALTRAGHRARVVGPAGFWTHRALKLPYPVHRWPGLRGRFREQLQSAELLADLAIWRADVVHAHITYPNGYVAARLKRRRPFPLVITPHGVDIVSIPELDFGMRLDPVRNEKITFAVRAADRVTAISRTIEDALLEIGADRERLAMVPNGVDVRRFDRPPVPSVREWLGTEPDARLIVTVGKSSPRKGHDYLVRAMPKVIEVEPRARLVIVGQGTDRLLPLIEDLGLSGNVVLTGGIPPTRAVLADAHSEDPNAEPDRLAEILCSSELYVSAGTERNAEGLSLAVLEAMAARLPIVATAISGNMDIVADGENGYLAEPADADGLADAIIRVLANAGDQAAMREGARATALRYSWDSVARRYLEVYAEAIAGTKAIP